MWSKKQQLEEIQFHINALRSIILGISLDGNACRDILRTLNYSLGLLREKRNEIRMEIDSSE